MEADADVNDSENASVDTTEYKIVQYSESDANSETAELIDAKVEEERALLLSDGKAEATNRSVTELKGRT